MLNYRPSLTPEKLFEKVSHYEIFFKYCNNWKYVDYKVNNKLFPSEFRDDDSHGSAVIKVSKAGSMYYVDYGENIPLKPINFVMRKFGLDFLSALRKIFSDFGISNYEDSDISKYDNKYVKKHNLLDRTPYTPDYIPNTKHTTIIKKKRRNWTAKDISYWMQYGWTFSMLDEARIEPISKYWVNSTKFNTFAEPSYSFEYYKSEGIFRRKLYFPYRSGKYRFLSNVDTTVIQGWHMLPKSGDTLFITKALKDIGPFKRLNYNAIASNTETSFIPKSVVNKLKKRYKRLIIWFDNDSAGVTNAIKYSEMYDLEYIVNPENTAKDPSDFVKKYDLNDFNNLIKTKANL